MDISVNVKNLCKNYRIYNSPLDRIKQLVYSRIRRYYTEFTALDDISFQIRRGETFGIIGRNGSGKSTLLQLICGILEPSSGSITTQGKIASMLELGSSFSPDFTGRENVYITAGIMGLNKKQVDEKFDFITDFADIGQFIDQPVKTYSNGMFLRLAFSVAISVDPEILVIDEVLAVGDVSFQRKCFNHLEKLSSKGATVIFVTHDLDVLSRFCTRAMLLNYGVKTIEGNPKEIIDKYHQIMFGNDGIGKGEPDGADAKTEEAAKIQESSSDIRIGVENELEPAESSYGNGLATITKRYLINSSGITVNNIHTGEFYYFKYNVVFNRDVENIHFGMGIVTLDGVLISGCNTRILINYQSEKITQGDVREIEFHFKANMTPGNYFFQCGVSQADGTFLHRRVDTLGFVIEPKVNSPFAGLADLEMEMKIKDITGDSVEKITAPS